MELYQVAHPQCAAELQSISEPFAAAILAE